MQRPGARLFFMHDTSAHLAKNSHGASITKTYTNMNTDHPNHKTQNATGKNHKITAQHTKTRPSNRPTPAAATLASRALPCTYTQEDTIVTITARDMVMLIKNTPLRSSLFHPKNRYFWCLLIS